MRVTQNMVAAQILSNITGSEGRLAKAQEQLATTKKINRASDDPQGSSLVLQMQDRIGATQAYQNATSGARDSLGNTSAALTQVLDLLQQAKDLATQGSSDTEQGSRATLADQVNQLLEGLVSQGGTESQGRYVFGGTQSTTPPFSVTRDGSGTITAVTASPLGIDGSINVQVAEGVIVQTNLPGGQAFTGSVDLFSTLIGLRDALNRNDTAGIAATIDTLKTGIDQVAAAASAVGATVQRLQAIEARNQSDLTRFKDLLSGAQDADIAEVYVDLQKEQNAYQASLAAGAKVFQMSLLDYLQ